MLKIGRKSINLAFAVTLTEEEFRGHYAPILKSGLEEAWKIVKSHKDASSDKPTEKPSKLKRRRDSEQTGNKGIHNPTEPEPDLH